MPSRRTVVLALVASLTGARGLSADVHLVRPSGGRAVIFNDDIGSGWRVNGRAPSDNYLLERRNAITPFDDAIRSHASAQGIDPALVKCVMLVESNYNQRAVSRKGARGLMQLMPDTARQYGVSNAFDPVQNIQGGVRFLSELLALYRGNVSFALAAYNAGKGAVDKYAGIPPYPETQEYVRRALIAYKGVPATADPVLAGGFRGASITPLGPRPRIQLDRSSRSLSNQGPLRVVVPVLGRVPASSAVEMKPGALRPPQASTPETAR